jgi:hypothetical protein
MKAVCYGGGTLLDKEQPFSNWHMNTGSLLKIEFIGQ